jgi:flagellar basal body rod protein FlgC
MSTIGPALSGMLAASTRLDVSAQNTANTRTPGYQAQQAVQSSTPSGVAVAKKPQSNSYFFADPFAPNGDASASDAEPEVDEGQEAVNRMQALAQFKANLQSLLSGEEMARTAEKII